MDGDSGWRTHLNVDCHPEEVDPAFPGDHLKLQRSRRQGTRGAVTRAQQRRRASGLD